MPAARSAWRSGSKVVSQLPTEASPHEAFTTSGASGASASPLGSSSHWKAWWSLLTVVFPTSSYTLAAIHCAPGATPIAVPPAVPPTSTPMVCVPCPMTSYGVAVLRKGSHQLCIPPRQRGWRSGCARSTPVSMFATTTPLPSKPRLQSAGAWTAWRFHSAAAWIPGAARGAGSETSSLTERTPGMSVSTRASAGRTRAAMASTIDRGRRSTAPSRSSSSSTGHWARPPPPGAPRPAPRGGGGARRAVRPGLPARAKARAPPGRGPNRRARRPPAPGPGCTPAPRSVRTRAAGARDRGTAGPGTASSPLSLGRGSPAGSRPSPPSAGHPS